MSRTLLPLAGFEVITNGRFWVTTEGAKSERIDQQLIIGALNMQRTPELD